MGADVDGGVPFAGAGAGAIVAFLMSNVDKAEEGCSLIIVVVR